MSAPTHDDLWRACRCLPEDYEPYGQANREDAAKQGHLDCSSGCRWYQKLPGPLGLDWGVCWSPTSYRAGLLTFEHMGGATCYQPEDADEA